MSYFGKIFFLWPLLLAVLACAGVCVAEPADFELQDLDGAKHKLSDYRGKWVVVNFWATWCPPCLDEIPELVKFHDEHAAKNAVVLGVNFEDIRLKSLREFVDGLFISYPVLRIDPDPVTPLGMIPGLPTTFIVAPDGQLVARQVGPVTADALESYIAKRTAATAGTATGGVGSSP